MEDIKLTYQDMALYLTIANAILGLLFGLFPLVTGVKLRNQRYAFIGFIAALLGGAVLGIIASFPIALIFTWLIVKGATPAATVAEVPAAEADTAAEPQ